MIVRFSCVLFLSSAVVPNGYADTPNTAPPECGMTRIFNGKDLTDWEGDPRLWSVKGGAIHGETTSEIRADGNTFLIWGAGQTKDFELRLSFRCSATNNSGIQYRSTRITENMRNDWVVHGYQHEIRNNAEFPNVPGFIYDEGGSTGHRGRIILVGQQGCWEGDSLQVVDEPLITAEEFAGLFRLGDWNEVVIIAQGNHIRHYMNGRRIVDFMDSDDCALRDGVLALQLHAGSPMFAEFKNIRIKHFE